MVPTASRLSTVLERAIAAEARAVEEGHHALWDASAGCFTVKSDSLDGVSYQVRPEALVTGRTAVSLRFTCTCRGARGSAALLPCKHAALVARRLERMRLARFDTPAATWRPLGALLEAAQAAHAPRPVAPVNVSALVD